jgi:hypothetical protein
MTVVVVLNIRHRRTKMAMMMMLTLRSSSRHQDQDITGCLCLCLACLRLCLWILVLSFKRKIIDYGCAACGLGLGQGQGHSQGKGGILQVASCKLHGDGTMAHDTAMPMAMAMAYAIWNMAHMARARRVSGQDGSYLMAQVSDQQRDQPGKCLYCARAFWLYLQSHYIMRNVSLMGVLYAYTRHLGLGSARSARQVRGHFASLET